MAVAASALPLLLDVFTANDEVAMVRYRLRLHQLWPGGTRTIIAESAYTVDAHAREGAQWAAQRQQGVVEGRHRRRVAKGARGGACPAEEQGRELEADLFSSAIIIN